MNWIDKHSVNCYFCNALVDERDCYPANKLNNNDGGDICLDCVAKKTTDEQMIEILDGEWDK